MISSQHGFPFYQTTSIGSEISDVLVALQFQNRVSQILGHVNEDIGKLTGYIVEHEAADKRSLSSANLDATAWLAALSRTYTVPEQLVVHHGGIRKAASIEAITFF